MIQFTLASVATATSATEVITSTHRIATHHQQNNQTVYSGQQTSHGLLQEHVISKHYHNNSSNHSSSGVGTNSNSGHHRKRKAVADGGLEGSKTSSHTSSTASSLSTAGAGAGSSSSGSIYQKNSNSLKMVAGHKHAGGSSQKVRPIFNNIVISETINLFNFTNIRNRAKSINLFSYFRQQARLHPQQREIIN